MALFRHGAAFPGHQVCPFQAQRCSHVRDDMTPSILTNPLPRVFLQPRPHSAPTPKCKGLNEAEIAHQRPCEVSQCYMDTRLPTGHVVVAAILHSIRLLKPVCSERCAKKIKWGKAIFSTNEPGTTRYPNAKDTHLITHVEE